MQRLALSAIVGKEASKDAMLIVLEVASGPPWRAGIWALVPALTLPIGSATSGVGGFVVDAAITAGKGGQAREGASNSAERSAA
jgi:hypothetical protein